MKTIVEFPDQGILAEESAEWLVRLDADSPPALDELKALGEWLHRSPAHREELESLARLWGRMNVLTELAVPLGKDARAKTRTRAESPAASEQRPWRWTGLRPSSVVASLMLAAAIGVLLLAREPAKDPLLASNGLYATAVGQQKARLLADGSEVILNTNSQIRVDYGGGYRQVHLLQGEALFSVAKDTERPFRVYAANGRIEALGTAFSVYLNGGDVNVTVTEGRVSLASLSPSRSKVARLATSVGQDPTAAGSGFDDGLVEKLGTLNAGQVATIRSSVAEAAAGSIGTLEINAPIPPDELAERLAWRDGILMFSGDRLEDVINEVGRYTTVSIEIPDAAVRNMRIGGRFPVGETEVMFSALETNFNLRVTHPSHNRVVISAARE
jgi:transmembrane sensor